MIKLDKKISRKIIGLVLFESIFSPNISYASGVDAYYDDGYFVIQDYGNSKISISKKKFNEIKDEEEIILEIGDTDISIDKEEFDSLIMIADKHEDERVLDYILVSGLFGGTLLGTAGVSKIINNKRKL